MSHTTWTHTTWTHTTWTHTRTHTRTPRTHTHMHAHAHTHTHARTHTHTHTHTRCCISWGPTTRLKKVLSVLQQESELEDQASIISQYDTIGIVIYAAMNNLLYDNLLFVEWGNLVSGLSLDPFKRKSPDTRERARTQERVRDHEKVNFLVILVIYATQKFMLWSRRLYAIYFNA